MFGMGTNKKGVLVVQDADEARRIAIRSCLLKMMALGGVAFGVLAQGAENLVKYLYLPGWFWIIGGTALSTWWAYEHYCVGDPPT